MALPVMTIEQIKAMVKCPSLMYTDPDAIDAALTKADWGLDAEVQGLVDMARNDKFGKNRLDAIRELRTVSTAALRLRGVLAGEGVRPQVTHMLPAEGAPPPVVFNANIVEENIRRITDGAGITEKEEENADLTGSDDNTGDEVGDAAGGGARPHAGSAATDTGNSDKQPDAKAGHTGAPDSEPPEEGYTRGSPRGRRPPTRIPRGGGLCGELGGLLGRGGDGKDEKPTAST